MMTMCKSPENAHEEGTLRQKRVFLGTPWTQTRRSGLTFLAGKEATFPCPALPHCALSPGVPRKVLDGLDHQPATALPCQTLPRAGLPLHLQRRRRKG